MTTTVAGQPVHFIQKRDLIAMLEPFRDDAYVQVEIEWKNAEAAKLQDELIEVVGLAKALTERVNDGDRDPVKDKDEFKDLDDWVTRNFDISDFSEPESVTGYILYVEKASTGATVIHAIGE